MKVTGWRAPLYPLSTEHYVR